MPIQKIRKDSSSGNVVFSDISDNYIGAISPRAELNSLIGSLEVSSPGGKKIYINTAFEIELIKADGSSTPAAIYSPKQLEEALYQDFFFDSPLKEGHKFEATPAGFSYNSGIFLPLEEEAAFMVRAKAVICTADASGPNGNFSAYFETQVTAKTKGGGLNLYSDTVRTLVSSSNFSGALPQNYIQPFFGSPFPNNEVIYRVQPYAGPITENLIFNVEFSIQKLLV